MRYVPGGSVDWKPVLMRSRVQSPGGPVHLTMVPLRTSARPPNEHCSQVAFWGRINRNCGKKLWEKNNSKQMPWVNLEYDSVPVGEQNGTLEAAKTSCRLYVCHTSWRWLLCWENWLWCAWEVPVVQVKGEYHPGTVGGWMLIQEADSERLFRGILLSFHWSLI